jgi:hypothetical protein
MLGARRLTGDFHSIHASQEWHPGSTSELVDFAASSATSRLGQSQAPFILYLALSSSPRLRSVSTSPFFCIHAPTDTSIGTNNLIASNVLHGPLPRIIVVHPPRVRMAVTTNRAWIYSCGRDLNWGMVSGVRFEMRLIVWTSVINAGRRWEEVRSR